MADPQFSVSSEGNVLTVNGRQIPFDGDVKQTVVFGDMVIVLLDDSGFDPDVKSWPKLTTIQPKSINDDLVRRHMKVNPDSTPHRPYDQKFPVVRGAYQPGKPPLVRVYPTLRNREGGWLMPRANYEDAFRQSDPSGILKEKFALPKRPMFVSDFDCDQSVEMTVGIASKHSTWG